MKPSNAKGKASSNAKRKSSNEHPVQINPNWLDKKKHKAQIGLEKPKQ